MESLQEQSEMAKIAFTLAFVGHAHMVTSLCQECDIVKLSCLLHLMIKISSCTVRFTIAVYRAPGGNNAFII